MLPAEHRLRRSREIDLTVRRGVRAGRPRLVVHLDVDGERADQEHARQRDPRPAPDAPRVAFAVSRAVGGAVTRNAVKRRLRHLVAPRLAQLPPGARVVVRALGPAAGSTSVELAEDLDGALRRALRRAERR